MCNGVNENGGSSCGYCRTTLELSCHNMLVVLHGQPSSCIILQGAGDYDDDDYDEKAFI